MLPLRNHSSYRRSLVIVLVMILAVSFLIVHSERARCAPPSPSPTNGPISSGANQPSIVWEIIYGGPNDDIATSLIQTSDGGFALAGSTSSFGAGGEDFWLVKTDAQGNIQWNKTYGGANDDVATCLIATSDGGFAIVGTTDYTHTLVVKTDANGNVVWSEVLAQGEALAIVETSDKGFAICGSTSGSVAGWLAKIDSFGNLVYSKSLGPGFSALCSLVETSDGGFALAGDVLQLSPVIQEDFWLVKTDSSGNVIWNQTYGGTNNENADKIIQTSDAGFALAGTLSLSQTDSPLWLVKTDSSGNMEWNQTFLDADTSGDYCSVIETVNGGFALAAGTSPIGSSEGYFWLTKTDANGNKIWSDTYGNAGSNLHATSLIQTSDMGYVIAGYSKYGNSDFGGADFCLMKTGPDPDIQSYFTNPAPTVTPNPTPQTTTVSATTINGSTVYLTISGT